MLHAQYIHGQTIVEGVLFKNLLHAGEAASAVQLIKQQPSLTVCRPPAWGPDGPDALSTQPPTHAPASPALTLQFMYRRNERSSPEI